MDEIYVIGHKKPDTDTVTASICLSYLRNKLGMKTEPRILGEINNETKFVLDYFKVKKPKYLNDVRLQIKDLNYINGLYVNAKDSIYSCFNYMNDNAITNVPVVNDKNELIGDASIKDIAKDMLKVDENYFEASYDNILKTINGSEILRFDDVIKGNILVAAYRSTTFIENINIDKTSILIVGDRHSIIEYAVNSGAKLIVLTGNTKIHKEHLEIARKKKVNIIKTDVDTFNTAKFIGLSKNIDDLTKKEDIVSFNENDAVTDFISTANKMKYSNFPVIDNNGKCKGIVKLIHTAEKKRKKVILVDHNEYEQSVDGLEEAEIIEIIDHHKIGTIGTNAPINFRNMPVGSTDTIVTLLYKENNVTISKEIAGLLMSGIISDTLLFASPTTTELDKALVKELSSICNVDYQKYGLEMFKAGSTLKDKTEDEIFYTDFKNFSIEGLKIGVSQISTINPDDILQNRKNYIKILNDLVKNNDYNMVLLFVTDILKNGSYIFFNNESEELVDKCFGKDLDEGSFLEGIVSRKKQVIPAIMQELEN